MKLKHFFRYNQLLSLIILSILLIFSLNGCRRSSIESPVLPPETRPLARDFIGFGVINVSFTHFLDEPGIEGSSQGYLRQGAVVRILERRRVINRGVTELWVLVEGNYQVPGNVSRGWLQENVMEIFDNESRAITASRAIIR